MDVHQQHTSRGLKGGWKQGVTQPTGLLSRLLFSSSPLGIPSSNARAWGQQASAGLLSHAAGLHHRSIGRSLQALVQQHASATSVLPNQPSAVRTTVSLGFQTNLEEKYIIGQELGKGGNGRVFVVTERDSGQDFACKAIPKVLPDTASEKKRSDHLNSIVREVQVLTKLRGSLNIVKLEEVFEDADYVYIVLEWCKGGELHHAVGDRHYSERTAASYMRAVLRTLAQCHAHNILHRDIKPGNFMLLNADERSPLKAIDFGLATPYEPEQLPRTDLGLEGTPWYMAPETLRSEWLPASDVWAAGVMAFQLLTGRFPFDDWRNPFNPSISAIWKSVLTDKLDFNKPHWDGISEEAKDFVAFLLEREPEKRPTAKEALNHPWLKGNSSERSTGKRLSATVVQSIQRYATSSVFKRTVLQSIATELLEHPLHPADDSAKDSEGSTGGSRHNGRPIIDSPNASAMQQLYTQLQFNGVDKVDKATLTSALESMGFRLEPSEIDRLMEEVDIEGTGSLEKSAFAASQMDWRYLQRRQTEDWLTLARRAFESIDQDQNGVLEVDEIISHLRRQLPEEEVQEAVSMALLEAGATAESGIDFPQFLQMLRVGSLDSLDIYDDRMSHRSGSYGSLDRLNSLLREATLDLSRHGALDGSVRSGRDFGQDRSNHSNDGSSHGGGGSTHNGGMLFRFDVGPTAPAPPPPSQAMAFRFDVGGPVLQAPDKKASSAAAGATISANAASLTQLSSVTGPSSVSGVLNVGRIGGYCDRQMHGSNLYKNVVLRGAALETVHE